MDRLNYPSRRFENRLNKESTPGVEVNFFKLSLNLREGECHRLVRTIRRLPERFARPLVPVVRLPDGEPLTSSEPLTSGELGLDQGGM
jgi:hypothetical protein